MKTNRHITICVLMFIVLLLSFRVHASTVLLHTVEPLDDTGSSEIEEVIYYSGMENPITVESVAALIASLDDTESRDAALASLQKQLIPYKEMISSDLFWPEVFPEYPGNDPEKWKRWYQWYRINDKQVVVRVYSKETESDQNIFRKVTIRNRMIPLSQFRNEDDNTLVVLMAEDQEDPLLRQLFSGHYYAIGNKWLRSISVPYYNDLEIKNNYRRIKKKNICDALGNVIDGAEVELILSMPERSTMAPGSVQNENNYDQPDISLAKFVTDGTIGPLRLESFGRDINIKISHDKYGIILMREFMLQAAAANLLLPLVAYDSKEAAQAYSGRVVESGPDQYPVSGASVAEGSNAFYKVITNSNGYFRYYSPPEVSGNKESDAYLNHVRNYACRFSIKGPGKAYAEWNDSITGYEAREIYINPYTSEDSEDAKKRFHKFEFRGKDGLPLTQEELGSVVIEIRRENKLVSTVSGSSLNDGLDVPNGTFQGKYLLDKFVYVPFQVLEITDNSPETIVFSVKLLNYSGKVIDALTRKPMQDVFVITQNKHRNKMDITDEQWQTLHALGDYPDYNDPSLKPFKEAYAIYSITRTGPDGEFSISYPEDNGNYYFTYLEKDYMIRHYLGKSLKPDGHTVCQIPEMLMYPAAEVLLQVNTAKQITLSPKIVIDKENAPQWATELVDCIGNACCCGCSDKQFEQEGISPNQLNIFHVPANITLQMKIEYPYHKEYADHLFPQIIHLDKGQALDLGECELENAVPFYVQVVDSKGKPMEGVLVHKIIGNHSEIGIIAGTQGMAKVWAAAGSQGEVAVCGYDFGPKYSGKLGMVNYSIESVQDAGKIYTLQLTDNPQINNQ